ncbi:SpoIID/LytB domain-containing protein [Paenibacillus sp. GCM10027626]|uniref:SpoIID/LytB domain-containing protein n=1 Tax=Paenibacillus sp. GCM10027626 TaxID=3273411 RepID=UPI003634B884
MKASEVTAGRKMYRGGIRPRVRRMAALLLALTLIVSVWTAVPSQGAVPKLDTIRVGLFIDHPKYKSTVPSITLSSEGALSVGFREPSGIVPLFQSSQQLRFTLDDFKVKVIETKDLSSAQAVAKRLKAAGGAGMLTASSRNGTTVYQVLEGSYSSVSAANTAAAKWGKDSTISGVTGSNSASAVIGPYHLLAGSYATEEEARAAANSWGAAGVEAIVGMRQEAAKKGQYIVLLGAETDESGLNALRTKAGQNADTMPVLTSSYILLRDDYTDRAGGDKLIALPGTAAKVAVTTEAATGIKLAERYNRNYRGQMEFSGMNSKLAVVNELPFEQYLYSVIGGEMPASWHMEALKAQAVAARTFALYQGFAFQIAHVADTTISQVYGGIGAEKPATIKAVDATAGEIVTVNGKVIETMFSSSAGGVSADSSEVWGYEVSYLKSVPSPDEVSEKGLPYWSRVVLPSGETGYIREDLLEQTADKTAAGSVIMRVKSDGVMVRPIPLVQDSVPAVAKAAAGTRVVILERVVQSNEMSWIRGPFTSQELEKKIKAAGVALEGTIRTLEVGKKGPSGRTTELLVNGKPLNVKYPDNLRGALGGLPSTLFEVDESARLAVAGAKGSQDNRSNVTILGANGKQTSQDKQLFVLNGKGDIRPVTKEPTFRFVGHGYGHGVGMSQYGARGLAEKGYDYQYILQYYYKDAKIVKD